MPCMLRVTFTEFLIVYVSCGAPFAVACLLSGDDSNRLRSAFVSTLCLTTWPAFLLAKLIRVIKSRFVSHKNAETSGRSIFAATATRSTLRELADQLQAAGVKQPSRQIKDLLERYSGLASLLVASKCGSYDYDCELALLSNHPSPAVATACVNRRNIALINRHLLSARHEFLELLETATAELKSQEPILNFAIDFVEQFDPDATSLLQRLRSRPDNTMLPSVTSTSAAHFKQSIMAP